MSVDEQIRTAVRLQQTGRLGEAEARYRAALQAAPRHPAALHLLGVCLRQAGRAAEGLELIERAVALAPDYAEAHGNLGNAYRDAGRLDEAAAAYETALRLRPANAGLWNNLGNLRRRQERLEEAAAALARAVEQRPDYAEAHFNLANTLQDLGRTGEALVAYRRAVALRGGYDEAAGNLAAACLKAGRPAEALVAVKAMLARDPQSARAVSYQTIALQELGRWEEARRLADLERLVFPVRLDPPVGWPDLASFNRALAAEIRGHPTLTANWDPGKRAARGGAVAVDIFEAAPPALAAFERALRAAIERLKATLPRDPRHPFLRRAPARYDFIAWANILESEGHQTAHIHNLGWASGTYYVELPPAIDADDPEHPGWIEFGRPGYGLPYGFVPEVRLVRPEPGAMLLFPSYMWHRTIPFTGTTQRISIAFDVRPLD